MSTDQPTGSTDPAAENPDPVSGAERNDEAGSPAIDPSGDPAGAAEDEVRAAGGERGDEVRLTAALDPTRVRRAPRYRRFAAVGGLLGVVLAAVFVPFAEETEYLSHGGLFVLLIALLVPVCILLMCILAALLDRRKR